ncbi:MAG TPA: ABC transporter permease [Pseudonocardiaceae bacterium]|jgi:ABC-2 type transport system permease protein|nr:ABC transporter permease [Pseudonocardiaceae bacterium]
MKLVLHAEWTKLRTTATTGWLLLAAVALTVMVGVLATSAVTCPTGGCGIDPAKTSLTGVYLGQAVVVVVAVLAIGGEYGTGMIRTTFTAMPHRLVVLGAKAMLLVGLVVAAGVVAVLGALLVGRPLLAAHGHLVLSLGAGPVLRAAVGSVLYLALIALLSLGIATAVRDSVVAIGLVLGLLYLFPIIGGVVVDLTWHRHLEQIGPMAAGLAVQATIGLQSLPIGPWAGLGVLAAWAAGGLLLGGLVVRLRDA